MGMSRQISNFERQVSTQLSSSDHKCSNSLQNTSGVLAPLNILDRVSNILEQAGIWLGSCKKHQESLPEQINCQTTGTFELDHIWSTTAASDNSDRKTVARCPSRGGQHNSNMGVWYAYKEEYKAYTKRLYPMISITVKVKVKMKMLLKWLGPGWLTRLAFFAPSFSLFHRMHNTIKERT